MNTKYLLDQLLRSGSEMLQQNQQNERRYQGRDEQFSQSNSNHQSSGNIADQLSSFVSGKGGAALAGGALGLLIGNKSGRKIGGKVLTYGGLAVLGTLAYKAYQNYQAQATLPGQQPAQPLELLPDKDAETHCKAILVALIAAAKADGHIDDREKQLIDQEVAKFTTTESLRQWLGRELQKPLDPAEVAKSATSETIASEMYLASLLAVDAQNFMEKSYLDELARQMNLPSGLKSELIQQVQQLTSKT